MHSLATFLIVDLEVLLRVEVVKICQIGIIDAWKQYSLIRIKRSSHVHGDAEGGN
jgi:hypothetical protein